MQQNERKGAWTLFVAILLFGAIVWGYGGYHREQEKREAEKVKIEKLRDSERNTQDSISVSKSKRSSNKVKGKRARGGKSEKNSEAYPVRDILSDSINYKR